jgi:hypothetical protein
MKRALIVLSFLLGACNASIPAGTGQPSVSPSPAISAVAPTASPSTSPSPSSSISVLGAGGSSLFPGTYSSQFDPAFIFTVPEEAVALDCAAGYECRGDINVNSPTFLDLEFGNVHGAEFMAARLDKVVDPTTAGAVIDPPADFAAWISAISGLTVLEPAKSVTVGGVTATQIDVAPSGTVDGLPFGPTFGIAGHATRVIGLMVAGHLVIFTGQDGSGDFNAAVISLQPIVDSIVWR